MKNSVSICSIAAAFITPVICSAQTTNTGELYVSPNTRFSSVSDFRNEPGATFTNNGDSYMYSDINNDGTLDYTGQQGLVRLVGQNLQQITGTNPFYLFDVYFDNSSGFSNSGNISIAHEADFTDGILDNDNPGGQVQFLEGAYHVSTSDNSFVDGPVLKAGSEEFVFPVGDVNRYRNCAISAPGISSELFKSKYFLQNPGNSYSLNSKAATIRVIDDQEYWEIDRESGSGMVAITLSWNESTTPSGVLSPASQLHVVRWDAAGGKWMDEGGIVDEVSKTVTTISKVETYGVFTLANVAGITVSQGVSPNGDGLNDALNIENLENFPGTKINIFNRWGSLVYESDDYQNDWEGTSESQFNIGGNQLPEGTYYYIVELGSNQSSDQSGQVYKGYFYLKRQ